MADNIRRVYEIDVKLAADAAAALKAMQQQMRDLENNAKKAKDALGGFAGIRLSSIGFIAQGIGALVDVMYQFTGIPLAKHIAEIDASLERLRLGFSTVDPRGLLGAAESIDYVRKVSNQLNTDFAASADSFLKLTAAARGTTIEGQKTREVFEAISLASNRLGLEAYATENAFRAIQQIISKGVLQQEELRGQLSEAIPGALQITARALGVTTYELNKMIAAGQVAAEDFVVAFAAQVKKEFGSEIPKDVNESVSAITRFNNAWLDLKQTVVDGSIGSAAAGFLNMVSEGMDRLSRGIKKAREDNQGLFASLNNTFKIKYLETLQRERVPEARAVFEADPTPANLEAYKRVYGEMQMLALEFQPKRDAFAPSDAAVQRSKEFIAGLQQEQAIMNKQEVLAENLLKTYRDKTATQKQDLENLEKSRPYFERNGDIDAYNRLREAIIKKNTVVTDGERAEKAAEKTAREFVATLRQEVAASQDLADGTDETNKLARERARIDDLLIGVSKSKQSALRAEINALLEQRRVNDNLLAAYRERQRIDKENATNDLRERDALEEKIAANEEYIKLNGREKVVTNEVTAAKYEALAADMKRLAASEEIGSMDEAEIARLERKAELYERTARSFRERGDEEIARFMQDAADESDRRVREKQVDDVMNSLRDNFRKNRDIGEAFLDTLNDTIRDRVFDIAIRPIIDPFIKMMEEAINTIANMLSESLSKALSEAQTSSGGSWLSAIGDFLGGLFSGTPSGQPSTTGYVSGIGTYAKGTITNGPELAMIGEAGREAVIPMPDNQSVPVKLLGSSGSGKVTVNVYSQGETVKSSSQSQDSQGNTNIEVIMEQIDANMATRISSGRGKTSRAMEKQYGLNRAVGAGR